MEMAQKVLSRWEIQALRNREYPHRPVPLRSVRQGLANLSMRMARGCDGPCWGCHAEVEDDGMCFFWTLGFGLHLL